MLDSHPRPPRILCAMLSKTRRSRSGLRIRPGALRTARLKKLWTQADLAKRAKLSDSAIAYMEQGLRGGSPQTIRRLARALGCDPFAIAEIVEEAS